LAVGRISIPASTNGTEQLLVTKLTSAGNLVWSKTFKWYNWDSVSSGSFDIYDCKEDVNGDIYLCGDVRDIDALPRRFLVFKITSLGNLIWNKSISTGIFPSAVGINIEATNIRVLGNTIDANKNMTTLVSYYLNGVTGDTLSTQAWYNNGSNLQSIKVSEMVKLNNGNFVLTGNAA
jgi:hypothetical protein